MMIMPLGPKFRYGVLRSLSESDVPSMLSWMHDTATASLFAKDFLSITEQDALRFVQSSWSDEHNIHMAVSDEKGTYLGTISLKDVNEKTRAAEYAIAMTVAARGTGAAMEGTRSILEIAFKELELSRVWLYVRESNARARRFYEKVGFHPCGAPEEEGDSGFLYYDVRRGYIDAKG